MNLRFLACSVDTFTSALDTTAHMLAYTDITYILFLNMNNGFGTVWLPCLFWWNLGGNGKNRLDKIYMMGIDNK